MKIYELSYPHTIPKEKLNESVAAIGLFDGIHLGHQTVIQTAIDKAKTEGKESAVITFHPNPAVVLSNGKQKPNYILPLKEKFTVLKDMGVDTVYHITFDKQLSALTPQQFIDHFVIGLDVTHLVAGFDYSFGHKGVGNMMNIAENTRDAFTYTVIDKLVDHDEKVSSTRIRNLLSAGNVQEVSRLLGRPYRTTATVVEGDKRGRTIGFPTANLAIDEDLRLPARGVYAVRTYIDNKIYIGMANLGYVPTFKSGEPTLSLEVYILDFAEDIYGKELSIEWLVKIRDEQKFNGVEEIIAQLTADEAEVRSLYVK